ncbi:MAG: helix-turn-helix domain-containing protein [Candidatus Binataceae bacterium]
MTVSEAAEYLHCHTSTLYRLVERGKILAFKLGGSWRLMLGELERWMSKQTLRIS